MTVSIKEKEEVFSAELLRIHDRKIREFTRLCIIQAPDYLFTDCPSSSSGKYHPIDELCSDGTIIHTKKVFTMAYELVKGFACEDNRDLVLSASIIHDLRKYGKENSGHTLKSHPALAAELVDEVQESTSLLDDYQHKIIRNCVGYHYGPWSEEPWKKDITLYTKEELSVYLSDYVVSKRFIATDYRR
jgi:hypothetical protein